MSKANNKNSNAVCHWEYDEDGFWATDCNFSFGFESDGIKENEFVYCPKCGRKIEEVATENDNWQE